MFVFEKNMCNFAFKLGILFYLKLCIILFGEIGTVHSPNSTLNAMKNIGFCVSPMGNCSNLLFC